MDLETLQSQTLALYNQFSTMESDFIRFAERSCKDISKGKDFLRRRNIPFQTSEKYTFAQRSLKSLQEDPNLFRKSENGIFSAYTQTIAIDHFTNICHKKNDDIIIYKKFLVASHKLEKLLSGYQTFLDTYNGPNDIKMAEKVKDVADQLGLCQHKLPKIAFLGICYSDISDEKKRIEPKYPNLFLEVLKEQKEKQKNSKKPKSKVISLKKYREKCNP